MTKGMVALMKNGCIITAVRRLKANYWLFSVVDAYGDKFTRTIHESAFKNYDFK